MDYTIEGFREICSMIYFAKRLYDLGRKDIIDSCFFDECCWDSYYQSTQSALEYIYDYFSYHYYERKCVQLSIYSCDEMVEYYILAGEYGEMQHISDKENPYFEAAKQETNRQFNFSYSVDFALIGHSKPKRPYHSRIGVFVYEDYDWVDPGHMLDALLNLKEWFSDECLKLKDKLNRLKAAEEVKAA